MLIAALDHDHPEDGFAIAFTITTKVQAMLIYRMLCGQQREEYCLPDTSVVVTSAEFDQAIDQLCSTPDIALLSDYMDQLAKDR